MKCDELEEEYLWTNNVKTPSTRMVRAYNADEVDKAIAELKEKLEDAGMRERRLKRAFLIALAHKAKYKKYWFFELLEQEGSKILSDNKKAKKYNAIIKMCQECEVKCRAKAEEYK